MDEKLPACCRLRDSLAGCRPSQAGRLTSDAGPSRTGATRQTRALPTITGLQFPISPHQFEETQGIPHGIDAADFVGINRGDRDGRDAMAFPARDDEHFGLVLEPAGAAQNIRNDVAMQHAKAALRIRNLLAADLTDFSAHVTVYDPSHLRPADSGYAMRLSHVASRHHSG